MNSIHYGEWEGGKEASWWITSGVQCSEFVEGLNGVQAPHVLTTDWAGKSLEMAGWKRFLVLLVLASGVVIWVQMDEHLAQGGQALRLALLDFS